MFSRSIAIASIFSFVLFFISCDKQKDVQPSEKEQILKMMKDFGFEEVKPSNARSSTGVTNTSIHTIEEAKAYLEEISKLDGLTQDLATSLKNANGRLRFVACEDQGTYYISRAINGGIGGVDIRYERNASGEVQNIFSYSSGITVAGWDQIGISIFDPKKEFCIDGIQTYGIDYEGLPLAYKAPVSLRIRLNAGDCSATITSRYRHC